MREHLRAETVREGSFLPAAPGGTDDRSRASGLSLLHPVGTCKMGIGEGAVVDPRLRIHGIDGLRVVDASIMPRIVTGNTNAAAIMIGEKGAALIAEDARK